MDLSERIVERFLTAKRLADRFVVAEQIADPKVALAAFEGLVGHYTRHAAFAKEEQETVQKYLDAKAAQNVDAIDRLTQQLKTTERPRREVGYEMRTNHDFHRMQAVARSLFLAILQTYALDTKVRRGVEAASRFWDKSKILVRAKPPRGSDFDATRAYLDLAYLETYLKVCEELQRQVVAAKSAVINGKLNSDPELAETVRIKAGSFTLVNTGGFPDNVMAKVTDAVEKAEKAMRGIGLGEVCYGDIHVTKTISQQRTVAFYLVQNDELFVRANLAVNAETLLTICHELAHRLQFKFLQSRTREIKQIYAVLKAQERSGIDLPEELLPKVGDTVVEKGVTYTAIEVSKYEDKVKLTREDVPPPTTFSMSFRLWLKLMGIEPHQNPKHRGFITKYASTDPDENFAEMVSYYAMGKLPAVQVEMLRPLLP